jgi:hypothetical protein
MRCEDAALLAFSSAKKFFGLNGKLLVNSFRFGFGNEFLKTWIIADRIPDRVDLQTSDGNDFSGRSCNQLAKYFYRLLGLASSCFEPISARALKKRRKFANSGDLPR